MIILGLVCSVQGQDEIPWKQDYRLSWSNFKGKPPKSSSAAATTASGISYSFSTFYEGKELKIDFNVASFFYPTKSWYRPKVCTNVTLQHEQLHFDITELYARKLRARLADASYTENVKEEVRSMYKSTLRMLNDFQNKYDSETNYSRNLPMQEKWTNEIKAALKE